MDNEDFYFEEGLPVWFDGMGFLDSEKRKILIMDTEAVDILDEFEAERFSHVIWHGDSLIVTSPHKENGKFFLWRYDIFEIRDGERKTLLENVPLRAASSNGKHIAMHGKPKAEKVSEHSYVYLYDGQKLEPVNEKFGLNSWNPKLDKDSNAYFLVDNQGRMEVWKVSGGKEQILFKENAWATELDVSDDGKAVFVVESETNPGELYFWNGKKAVKITDYNSQVEKALPMKKAKHFSFKSIDLEIDGWYLKPDLKEGEKAPVILFVHGGPKGMYGYRFEYMMQHLVSEGFFVVYFNPRGSSGYSEDFALRVLERTGLEDFQDIMNGLDKFFEMEKQAAPERIGITGISYGGFMTNWAVTQTDRFKAAVSENGISYWLTSYSFSDIGLWFDKEVIGEDPLRNENYRKLSPLFHVEKVKTPILIIHSLEDYRCPLDQSVMFYHALKDLGKEAYIAIFKKGPHGHSRRGSPRHRAKRHKLIVEFFKRKLIEGKEGFPLKEILKGQGEG